MEPAMLSRDEHISALTPIAPIWFLAPLADIASKGGQGLHAPKGEARFVCLPMAWLSQARRLGGLLPPHSAFQGDAPHTMRWPMMLTPNDSRGTCIPPGDKHIPP